MTGNELRQARKTAALTQDELAAHWGITRRTLGKWEKRGTEPVPNPKMVKILADLLIKQ